MNLFSYDLITQTWIPALALDGHERRLGLLDLLAEAHTLQDLTTPAPVVKASLYRLLLALLGRIFQPQDAAGWTALQSAGAFDRGHLEAYFSAWSPRFDLFHPERPFFQAPDRRVKPKKLLKMVPHLASGNNPTLFDHSTEKVGITLTPAEAALYLVALQYFGLGGLSGIEEKFTNAPTGKGVNFFVQGENLFESLLLNLHPAYHNELHGIPSLDPALDRPCWEMEDPFDPRPIPYGWFDYLTWQNRRVLLFPEEQEGTVVVRCMTEAPGLRLREDFINGNTVRDPYHYYRKASTGLLPLRFTEDRAVWRDSAALLGMDPDAAGLLPPPSLAWLQILARRHKLWPGKRYQVQALGLASDKAKALFYGDERLPLPLEFLLDPDCVDALKVALGRAESAAKGLRWAVACMAEVIASFDWERNNQKPDPRQVEALRNHLRADRVYWSELENDFHALVERIPSGREAALQTWNELLVRVAWRAFEHSQALAGEDARAQKAAVRGRAALGASLNKVFHH